jgi:hypothetical protein
MASARKISSIVEFLKSRSVELYDAVHKHIVQNWSSTEMAEIDATWSFFRNIADRDAHTQMLKEPHQRWWELYLCCALTRKGHKLVTITHGKGGGPDFLVEIDGSRIWIEAVCPKPGKSPPDNADSVSFGFAPINEMTLRCTNALSEKLKKYRHYEQIGVVAHADLKIIAVSTGDIWRQTETDVVRRAATERGVFAYEVARNSSGGSSIVSAGYPIELAIPKSAVPNSAVPETALSESKKPITKPMSESDAIDGVLYGHIEAFRPMSWGALTLGRLNPNRFPTSVLGGWDQEW